MWALGLGAAATRTANPLLLGLIVAVAALVVSSRRPQAQWSGAFPVFVRLALLVIVIRVGFAILFGVRVGTTDLFTLPSVTLPEWMAGVTLGGPVTAEMLAIAAAIETRGRFSAKRCAVWFVGDRAFFESPRNSQEPGVVTLADADDLAREIRAALATETTTR